MHVLRCCDLDVFAISLYELYAFAQRFNHRRVVGKRSIILLSEGAAKQIQSKALRRLDDAAVSYQLLLTKCDELKPEALAAMLAKTQTAILKHPAAFPDILTTSSRSKLGIDALRQSVIEAIDAN